MKRQRLSSEPRKPPSRGYQQPKAAKKSAENVALAGQHRSRSLQTSSTKIGPSQKVSRQRVTQKEKERGEN